MKQIYLTILVIPIFSLILSACSQNEPSEPYYDRAQKASQKAHNQLSKE